MTFDDTTLTDRLAYDALARYGWQDTHTVSLLMVSENVSYAVINRISRSTDAVLRISRPGYHTLAELVSEVKWIEELSLYGHGISPAKPLHAADGSIVQSVDGYDGITYYCIMFEYIAGISLDKCSDDEIIKWFHTIGRTAASMHIQSAVWSSKLPVDRPHFGYDNIIGEHADWGRWQERKDIDAASSEIISKASGLIKQKLEEYGSCEDNYGLIHADMRLANIIIADSIMHIIDFDDCGFGWYVSDYAASISFIEDNAVVPYLKDAWLEGYTGVRALSDTDIAMSDTFVMMRRLQLTAWMAGHPSASPVKLYSDGWIEKTVILAKNYIKSFF